MPILLASPAPIHSRLREQVALAASSPAARNLRGDSGTTLVETAIVMPVFLLLVFGLINFALVVFGACNLAYATRLAERYACLHSLSSGAPATQPAVNALVAPFIFPYPANTYTPAISYDSGGNNIGSQVTVSITVTYNLILPLYTYSGLNLTSSASGIVTQ